MIFEIVELTIELILKFENIENGENNVDVNVGKQHNIININVYGCIFNTINEF